MTHPKTWRRGCIAAGLALAALLSVRVAFAAPLEVRVQPSGNAFSTAYVITDESRTYFGNVEGGTADYQAKWEFSDGTATAFAAVADPRYISVDHTFTTSGSHWARLTIQDADGTTASATIELRVLRAVDDTLERKKNSAVDRGLREMYLNAQPNCTGGGGITSYFQNWGANSGIYGWTTDRGTAHIYYTYYFGNTVCPGTFTVDWGDGTISTYPGFDWYCGYPYAYVENLEHTYAASGPYTISVSHDGTTSNPFITVGVTATVPTATTGETYCWAGTVSSPYVGSTAMALVALENHGHNLEAPASDIYKKLAEGGVQYLLNQASAQALSSQTCIGDPEAGNDVLDGTGITFGYSTYEYSLATLALANSCTEAFAKARTVAAHDAYVNGKSLWDVVLNAKDYLAWAQSENWRACASD
ncbi:MAG: PKD domain-containing protein, partial [Deltaproteobacteria bacterium]|nr:PKD domain-containing protein [Deltaproteobacteria bacterium]